jgi:2-C-methyl-D-erythritol 4-phosphate cytidylyltransferase
MSEASTQKSVSAIIAAAGSGSRFGGKKQFARINGEVVLKLALNALRNAYPFDEYIVGIAAEDSAFVETLGLGSDVIYSPGGADRLTTVINAVEHAKSDFVAVHDAVRPFVKPETVQNTIRMAFIEGAAICGLFPVDTIKLVKDGRALSTIDRNTVFLAHTPQVFEREKLLNALKLAAQSGKAVTDEAGAYELAGYPVHITLSDKNNIKITFTEDI